MGAIVIHGYSMLDYVFIQPLPALGKVCGERQRGSGMPRVISLLWTGSSTAIPYPWVGRIFKWERSLVPPRFRDGGSGFFVGFYR